MPDRTRNRLAEAALTYSEVGATVRELPTGYHHLRRRVLVGHGQEAFADAAADVAAWQVQLRAGLTVTASTPNAIPGAVAALGLGVGLAATRRAVPSRVHRGGVSAPRIRIRNAARTPGKRRGSLHRGISRRRQRELHHHGVLEAVDGHRQDRRTSRAPHSKLDNHSLPAIATTTLTQFARSTLTRRRGRATTGPQTAVNARHQRSVTRVTCLSTSTATTWQNLPAVPPDLPSWS